MNNAKTFLQELLKETLGKFTTEAQNEFFSWKRSYLFNSEAVPEVSEGVEYLCSIQQAIWNVEYLERREKEIDALHSVIRLFKQSFLEK